MERADFISKLGIGMVVVCVGCGLASCGSKGNDLSPSDGNAPSPPTQTGPLFTVDLGSQLSNVGSSTVSNGVIVVRIATGNDSTSFTAVQVACTHQGAAIGYNEGQGIFICPRHGSEFSKTGAVVLGPAASPLRQYAVTIDATTLTVSG
ncbi:MAG: ubiquinol-cytochrome c reductase iron-sulfur subunit [Sphingobacteriales bacterium]